MSDPREITVSHTVDAPRDLVFETWTRPDHLDRWWGPRGFVTTTEHHELRVGGEWRFHMRHAEHGDYPNRVRYTEILVPERLTYEHDSGIDDDPKGFSVTVTFHARGAQTEVVLSCVMRSVEAAEEARRFGAGNGGRETLARMGEALAEAAKLDLVIQREVRAPRSVVWRAWTEAEHLGRWWGPKGLEIRVVRMDLRPGGLFLYTMTGAPGTPMAGTSYGRFVYAEIVPEERLVWSNGFSDEHGGPGRHPLAPTFPAEVLNVATFAEADGVTTISLRSRPIRATAEEMAIFAAFHEGMQAGYGATLDQLVALLDGPDRPKG